MTSSAARRLFRMFSSPAVFAVVLASGAMVVALGAGGDSSTSSLPGPVEAEVLRVIDGDTIEISARIWLGQTVTTHVRLVGIDTPELRGKCETEKRSAQAARDFLSSKLPTGTLVRLYDVTADKYGGRVLARLVDAQGTDLNALMLRKGFAREAKGGHRSPWCDGE